MIHSVKTPTCMVGILLCCLIICRAGFCECPECEEVAKGNIPLKYLNKSIKTHPSGMRIWDNEEAIVALKDRESICLWVDTRPSSFLKAGTIRGAVNLVCDLKGAPMPEKDTAIAITKEKLVAEMNKIHSDANQITVVFFCQGPKCHRSYDAALRSVSEYGLNPEKIVWYRDGYPNLEKMIMEDPKLKRRISRYLSGDILSR